METTATTILWVIGFIVTIIFAVVGSLFSLCLALIAYLWKINKKDAEDKNTALQIVVKETANVLAVKVESTALVLADSLKEFKNDIKKVIEHLDERVRKLEQENCKTKK